jgi:SAM-dependent methyltransferase
MEPAAILGPISMNDLFARCSDPEFRARAVHEWGTIRRFVAGRIPWPTARILDFGCGRGIAAASIALRLPEATVFGCDIVPPNREVLEDLLREQIAAAIPRNLHVTSSEPGTLPDAIADLDLIYAWSVFEHVRFDRLVATLELLRERLRPRAFVFLQVNPLYFSPRGSHLYRFLPQPWSHLELQLDVMRAAVADAHDVSQQMREREWEQFMTLNRATTDDLLSAAREADFQIVLHETLSTEVEPSVRLLQIYSREILTTEEVRILLRKK